MFSLLNNGFTKPTTTEEIGIEELVQMIKNNENKDLIKELHTLVRRCRRYNEIKAKLPCIKPHATFNKYGKIECLKQLSGYLYFDIDNCDVEEIKNRVLKQHKDKICLMGKSVGGAGLFFYIKLSNQELLSIDNFKEVQDYFINYVFSELDIDTAAKGIVRNQIIPYDENVYFNSDVVVTIPKTILNRNNTEVKKYTSNSIKKEREKTNIGKQIFLDIKEVNKIIKWKTYVEVGDADYIVSDVEVCNLFFSKVIKNDTKRYVYSAMVNAIMHNNPGVELIVVLSFINFVNKYYTDGQPMEYRCWSFMVEREYNRIKEGGKIKGTRIKRVHTNPRLDTLKRIRIAAKVNGKLKQDRSTLIVRIVYEALKEDGIKPTIKRVAAVLEGRRSIGVVQAYFPNDTGQLIKEPPKVQEIKFQKWLKEFRDEDFLNNHYRHLEEDKYYRIGYEMYEQEDIPQDDIDEGVHSEMELYKWVHNHWNRTAAA